MATITKISRKTGVVYKARIRRDGQSELSKTFMTKSDAQKWARKFEVEQERGDAGLVLEAHRRKVAEAIDRYSDEVLPELVAETARKYIGHLELWSREVGHLTLAELTPKRISELRDSIAVGRSPGTVNRYLATLGSVLTACVKRWHWLQTSPMQGVLKPTEDNAVTRYLTDDELNRLMESCAASKSHDLLLAVVLSLTTGARQGEILGLRWKDVDLKSATVLLRVDNETTTKGGIRSVPIVPQALQLLTARRDALCSDKVAPILSNALIFPSRTSANKPISLRTPWETALKRAAIPDFRWHDQRHSAASFFAKHGATLLEIGAILGHKSANTTKRYAHLTQQHTDALVLNTAKKAFGQD